MKGVNPTLIYVLLLVNSALGNEGGLDKLDASEEMDFGVDLDLIESKLKRGDLVIVRDQDQTANLCLAEFNAIRAEQNVKPLTYDKRLETAARNRNDYRINHNCRVFANCPGEKYSDEVALEAGYNGRRVVEIENGLCPIRVKNCTGAANSWVKDLRDFAVPVIYDLADKFEHVGCDAARCEGCKLNFWTCLFGISKS